MDTKYSYHVTNTAGDYKGTWDNDVTSEFSLTQQINTAGGQVVVVLTRPFNDFGEGKDVGDNYRVVIWEMVGDASSVIKFQGKISKYETNERGITITLLGHGAWLKDYVIESGESLNASYQTDDAGYFIYSTVQFYQTFTPLSSGQVSAIALKFSVSLYQDIDYIFHRLRLYSGTPTGSHILLAEVDEITSNTAVEVHRFNLSVPVSVTSGGNYFWHYDVLNAPNGFLGTTLRYNSTGGYSGGTAWIMPSAGADRDTPPTVSTVDAWFKVFMTTGNVVSPYLSYDPSNIAKGILDEESGKGGLITYDSSTIDLTGMVVSYTFNFYTTLEGIQKIIDLVPSDWYWWIDQATNKYHLHPRPTTVSHTLTDGGNITSISCERDTENMANVVYLTGGDDGSGQNVFSIYRDDASIAEHGRRVLKYTDGNVKLQDTADIIGQGLVDRYKNPIDSVTVEVAATDYPIHTFVLGQLVGFGNFGDVTDSLKLQIVAITRGPDSCTLTLAQLLPAVSKRIEDIKRNLTALETANNPAEPS